MVDGASASFHVADPGLPGVGLSYGFGSVHDVGFRGRKPFNFKVGHLPQGQNPIASYIPVSRIADMLLDPECDQLQGYLNRSPTLTSRLSYGLVATHSTIIRT